MSTLLYTHSKHDLEKIVRLIVQELHKTNVGSIKSIEPGTDRLTQREAAKFLSVSVATIISWKKKNKIPYYEVGRSIFYSKKELLEIAQKNRETLR